MRKKKQANIKNIISPPQITQVSTAEDWKRVLNAFQMSTAELLLVVHKSGECSDKAAALTSSGGKFHTNYSENAFPAMLKWLKVKSSFHSITQPLTWIDSCQTSDTDLWA